MTEETDVAVVGAGGGGTVLALALAKQGISTIVLDQAVGPPKGLRGSGPVDHGRATNRPAF